MPEEPGDAGTVPSRGEGHAAPAAVAAMHAGTVAGYRIDALAGAGGMGVVYRATDTELGRTVALKLIAPERAADPALRELFVRESLTAASLEHPNVIPIHRAGEDDGQLFIAMRFVEGASLQELITTTPGGIPPGRAARIVARVADALDAAHARGLVHRDVKPANILIADPDGEEHVYLTDFGLSVPTTGRAARGGRTPGWAGTLSYLAPEQIDGSPLDARTDVYALGCVLFHALTGRPPFAAGDEEAVLEAHRSATPPAPSSVVPGLPPAMDAVVQRAMAKRPDDRFATAGELGRAALSARYDVALLVADGDRGAADIIAAGLAESGMHALVAAGDGPRTAEGVRASGACAVVVGRGGLGEWARTGLSAARELAVRDRAFRLALVLLPGAPHPADPGLAYLATHPWVDLRAGVSDALAAGDLVRALRGADVPAGLPADSGECPYRGLEAFREEDASLYFGREEDTARLIERLRTTRFVAVLGPSGSGKSSLVRAGLLPAVRRGAIPGGEAWRVIDVVPGEHPLAALAAGLGQLPGAGAPSPADLGADERTLDVAAAAALGSRPEGERVMVLVDQLEEAFTLCADAAERAAFLGNLVYAGTIPGGRVVVVASMRADFYHRLAEHPELRALVSTHQHLVGPMDARALRRAIEEPARHAGLELEPGLTRRILTDVADRPGTLPLLEHLLVELWQRRRGRTLTLEAYAASGGVEGALARRANEVYGAMSPERQAVARRILLRLTRPGEGTEDTRRRAARSELMTRPEEAAEVDAVLDSLTAARLVTAGRDPASDEAVVEVTHEALIRGWPELRGWIDEDRDRLRAERRLSDATAEWERGGREDGALYRGARLLAWQERDRSALNPGERAFLAASDALAERERATRRQRTRIAIGTLAGVAAVVAAVAVFALVQRSDANEQRDVATSRQLAGSSALARERDPELATLLAQSAYATAPTVEGEESLRQGVHDSSIRAALRTPDELVIGAVPAAGGGLAIANESGTLRLWDPEADPRGTSPDEVGTWPGGIGAPPAPTDEGWVTGDRSGVLALWPDLGAPGAPERMAKVPGQLVDLHALSDGSGVIVATTAGAYTVGLADRRPRRIAEGGLFDAVEGPAPGSYLTAGFDGTVQRWSDGSSAGTPIPGPTAPRALTVSPDGALLAVSDGDGVDVIRLADDSAVFSAPMEGGVNDVAWSADGGRLAVGGGDASVRIYTRDGRLASRMEGHEASINTVAFVGPAGVASVAGDGSTRVWDATAGVERQLRGRTPAPVGGLAFDDRARVTLVEVDGSAARWNPGRAGARPLLPALASAAPPTGVYSAAMAGDLTVVGLFGGRVVVRDASGDEVASATFPDDLPIGVAVDPRGRRAAVALGAGPVEVIDIAPDAKPQIVGDHEGSAYAVGFSPVDETLASGGRDGTVKVWGGPGGSRTLGSHDGGVTSVAFSPDGTRLATGGLDRTVRIWDLSGQEDARIIRSHQGGVLSVTFAGGDRVVSGGDDAVRVTDWRRGVTLLTVPRGALSVAATGEAPAIAYYGADNVVRQIACDVCGPVESVEAAAQERTTRELTEAEQTDFHVQD